MIMSWSRGNSNEVAVIPAPKITPTMSGFFIRAPMLMTGLEV